MVITLPKSPHDRTNYSSHHIVVARIVRFQQIGILPDVTRIYLDTNEHIDVGVPDNKVVEKLKLIA